MKITSTWIKATNAGDILAVTTLKFDFATACITWLLLHEAFYLFLYIKCVSVLSIQACRQCYEVFLKCTPTRFYKPGHSWGWSFRWTAKMCRSMLNFTPNSRSHSGHLKRKPSWSFLMWPLRAHKVLNAFPQTSQVNLYKPFPPSCTSFLCVDMMEEV